jgi:hypothetical protein
MTSLLPQTKVAEVAVKLKKAEMTSMYTGNVTTEVKDDVTVVYH